MLERSSLPTYVSTELTDSLQQTFNRRRLDVLQELLWLPETYRQYLLLLVSVVAVGVGMSVHVWLNVQIAEEQRLVGQLAAQQQQIERENSEVIFAIANSSTLARVEEAALQQGFKPATARAYVRRESLLGASGAQQLTLPAAMSAPPDGNVAASGFLDAIGRGAGAAGDWLQQSAAVAAQAASDVTSGFKERWMP